MTTLTIAEATADLGALSKKVSRNGESIELTEAGEVLAWLTPPRQLGEQTTQGLTCGELADRIAARPRMPVEEAEAFALAVEEAVRDGNRITPVVVWPS